MAHKIDFPPLLTGHELKLGQNPLRKAASGAAKGKYGAGDLLWVRDPDYLDYAIVLEPEVDRLRAQNMIFAQMTALGDAIGAIAPPEVGITHHWPNRMLANGADFGSVSAIISDEDGDDGCPCYMVIGTQLAVRPRENDVNPGLYKDRTTLWDEGCGELDAMKVLESAARHFLTWVHTWEEEGFQPILTQIDGRMETGHAISLSNHEGHYLGMDENANLLLKREGGTDLVAVADALDMTIGAHVE